MEVESRPSGVFAPLLRKRKIVFIFSGLAERPLAPRSRGPNPEIISTAVTLKRGVRPHYGMRYL